MKRMLTVLKTFVKSEMKKKKTEIHFENWF